VQEVAAFCEMDAASLPVMTKTDLVDDFDDIVAGRRLSREGGSGPTPGAPGIGCGVVAVRCPARAAEQRPEGQQGDASNRDPNASSGQDVQG
jgi:hypothetical protein